MGCSLNSICEISQYSYFYFLYTRSICYLFKVFFCRFCERISISYRKKTSTCTSFFSKFNFFSSHTENYRTTPFDLARVGNKKEDYKTLRSRKTEVWRRSNGSARHYLKAWPGGLVLCGVYKKGNKLDCKNNCDINLLKTNKVFAKVLLRCQVFSQKCGWK
jgi:hypothetical protein